MMSLSDDKKADIIDALNTSSRYLRDILNLNDTHFGNMVSQIYPSELQLNKANTSDTQTAFLNCISPFQMILFLPKFTIHVTILIFLNYLFPILDGEVPGSTHG